MIKTGLEFFVERSLARNCLDLYLARQHNQGAEERLVAIPIAFTFVAIDAKANGPAISLSPDDGIALMDELWRAGVRPTEIGGAGALKATERHLEDMQAIAIGLLRQQGVQL